MKKLLGAAFFLAFLLPALASAAIFCPNLTENMKLGYCDQAIDDPDCIAHVQGDQVSQLQHFLSDYYPSVPASCLYLGPIPLWQSGFFGPKTKCYVIEFQKEWDLPTTGNVFHLTRAAIAQACTSATPPPPTSAPSCNLDLNPASITLGQSSTLSWTSQNATGGYIAPGIGLVGTSGSKSVSPQNTTTYEGFFWHTLTDLARCSTTLTVSPTSTGTAPCAPLDGITLEHGQSHTFYLASTTPFGMLCSLISQTRTCMNGVLSGSAAYKHASCRVDVSNPPLSCITPWGEIVPDGQAVSAYQSPTVPAGQQCVQERRECHNGVLSGSYQYKECSVQTATNTNPSITITAPADGTSIPAGGTFTLGWTIQNPPTGGNLLLIKPSPPVQPASVSNPQPTGSVSVTLTPSNLGQIPLILELRNMQTGHLLATSPQVTINVIAATSNPSITINEPAEGTEVPRGSTITASWTSQNAPTGSKVSVYYGNDTGWNNQTQCQGTSGSCQIQVGNLATAQQYVWVILQNANGQQIASDKNGIILTSGTTGSPAFNIGDRVKAPYGTSVRATPSLNGTNLGYQVIDALGTVTGGPTNAEGYTWWNINWDNHPDGWVMQNGSDGIWYLVKVTQ